MWRSGLLAFIAASGSVHLLPELPGRGVHLWLWLTVFLLTVIAVLCRYKSGKPWVWVILLWAAAAGFSSTVLRADTRLADALADSNVNLVSRVELRVVSLPRRFPGMQSFDAEVLRSVPDGVPGRIRVSWRSGKWRGPYAGDDIPDHGGPQVVPGQIWRMALILKPPHGSRNPHGFDYEQYMFAQGVRAVGTVRGEPALLGDDAWHSLAIVAERARYKVRERMLPYLQDKRYGAVLLALAIGDQASVRAADWDVFNRTGITHLVSISGTHVTMIAGLGGLVVAVLWRRLRFRGRALAERIPAQVAAGFSALLVAWLYCLLAGWGVPAQRTFLMLAVIASSYMLRLCLAPSQLLVLAAFVVIALDPWAIMSSGFWLSFGAVGVLMAIARHAGKVARIPSNALWDRSYAAAMAATRIQLMISAALLPALALLFNQVSIASPLANAYAIPVVSVLVTPLSLLAALFAVLPGMEPLAEWMSYLAHVVLHLMMTPTAWLADQSLSSINVASAPVVLTLLALLGLVVAFLPLGVPRSVLGWALILPALAWTPARPSYGDWDAVALDVGQAAAVVIKTARHNVLFDTGLRHSATVDSASRIILPYFRSSGVSHLHALVVSHADIDHVGGLRSLLDAISVEQVYSSFNIDTWLRREASMIDIIDTTPRPRAMTSCHQGQQWEVDGVRFQILWPPRDQYSSQQASSRERNDRSCVLRIQGQHHSLLLTGDISATPEHELLNHGLGAHDAVMAAHHGSNSSSSLGFVDAVRAGHAVMQAGAWSRYGHPHPAAVQRWENSGAKVWRTDLHGAVIMQSRGSGLHMQGERQRKRRYWQTW